MQTVTDRIRVREWTLSLLGIASILLLWYVLTDVLEVITSLVLPSPFAVYETFVDVHELILDNLWPTLIAGSLGFLIALALAVIVAIAVLESELARVTLMPYLIGGNTIPRVAVAPLIIFYVDVGTYANLIIAAWIAFFPMFINIKEGLEEVDEDQLRFFDLTGARTWQEYRFLRLPTALPYIFDAMKIGVTAAFVGAVIGEFVTTEQGIGYLALIALMSVNVPLAMATVFAIGLVTTLAVYVIFLIEARVMFWEDASMFS